MHVAENWWPHLCCIISHPLVRRDQYGCYVSERRCRPCIEFFFSLWTMVACFRWIFRSTDVSVLCIRKHRWNAPVHLCTCSSRFVVCCVCCRMSLIPVHVPQFFYSHAGMCMISQMLFCRCCNVIMPLMFNVFTRSSEYYIICVWIKCVGFNPFLLLHGHIPYVRVWCFCIVIIYRSTLCVCVVLCIRVMKQLSDYTSQMGMVDYCK